MQFLFFSFEFQQKKHKTKQNEDFKGTFPQGDILFVFSFFFYISLQKHSWLHALLFEQKRDTPFLKLPLWSDFQFLNVKGVLKKRRFAIIHSQQGFSVDIRSLGIMT